MGCEYNAPSSAARRMKDLAPFRNHLRESVEM